MKKQCSYILFFIWISYLITAGILLFSRGFLLTRITQNEYSNCGNVNSIQCGPRTASSLNITNGHNYHCHQNDKLVTLLKDVNASTNICLPKTANVVLILIDALKYDFAKYETDIEDPLPYQNKLPIINELLTKFPDNTRLMKFLADPPTTTLQRLKGLTTGSLPTFIDVGSNFAASEINEDNIIDQLVRQNRSVIFMGDDTWTGLYPNRFLRSYPYPSFNVFDLDTVDNGIRKHLVPEIKHEDWDLLIAHFLGVDHCGHRYGPFHNEMARKLTEMNEIIRDVVQNIDDDTVLMVFGDHGMTNTGDHGGDSDAEISSALFVYSRQNLISSDIGLGRSSVKQVDLVPTLATILGVPVPYSNLGSIILDALPSVNQNLPFSDWQYAVLWLWKNVKQVTEYINTYSSTSDQLQDEKIEYLQKEFEILSHRVQSIYNDNAFKSFATDAKHYILTVREMCEEVWVQFDSFSMSRGILLTFLTVFFVYLIVDGIPTQHLPDIFKSSFLVIGYSSMFLAVIISFICYITKVVDNLELTIYFTTGIASILMFVMLIIQNWEIIALNWHEKSKTHSWSDRFVRILLLLSICGLFTNSYIIEEGAVLSFLTITAIIVAILTINKPFKVNKISIKSTKVRLCLLALVAIVLIRSASYYFRCREEQFDCSIIPPKLNSASKLECLLTLISLAVMVTIIRLWLRSCGNLVGFSANVAIARYVPSILVAFMGGYWVLKRLPKDVKTTWQPDSIALLIYGVITISLLYVTIKPLCVYIIPKKRKSGSVWDVVKDENIIPQIFNHVKCLYARPKKQIDKNEEDLTDIPIVCGLGTVYSSVFIIFGVFIALFIALLHGVVLAPAVAIMFLTCGIVAGVLAIVRFETANSIDEIFNVPAISLLTWMFLSLFFFYGTGHQPTFPTIQWEAAFVGIGGHFVSQQNNVIPAILVLMNTFGAQIIMGIMLPLLLIAPFSLYIMFPSLAAKSDGKDKDMRRGELIIYEKDEVMIDGLFVASCKYILLHGIRLFACMLAATIHCRHLMVWKIFAPKLIFDSFAVIVGMPSVLIGLLIAFRINSQVEKLVIFINKER